LKKAINQRVRFYDTRQVCV